MEDFLQDAERLAAAEEGGENEDAEGLLGAGQLLQRPLHSCWYWFLLCTKGVVPAFEMPLIFAGTCTSF